MHEHYRARHAQRRVVVWGCSIHHTPRGMECTGCGDQGELFATSEVYRSAREEAMNTTTRADVELCPACGQEPRWVNSEPNLDYWECPCGHEYVITIEDGSPGT